MRIPPEARQQIVMSLYQRFDEMSWEERNQKECSAAYERFVEDENIGEKLKLYLPQDAVRVWIKDGPAKEYRRALEGMGPYASYTQRQAAAPEAVVSAALGRGWHILPETISDKPMRCLVERSGSRKLVLWGAENALKDLFWHAALHVAEGQTEKMASGVIVLTKRGNAPVDTRIWSRAKALSELIDVEISQASLAVTWKPKEE